MGALEHTNIAKTAQTWKRGARFTLFFVFSAKNLNRMFQQSAVCPSIFPVCFSSALIL